MLFFVPFFGGPKVFGLAQTTGLGPVSRGKFAKQGAVAWGGPLVREAFFRGVGAIEFKPADADRFTGIRTFALRGLNSGTVEIQSLAPVEPSRELHYSALNTSGNVKWFENPFRVGTDPCDMSLLRRRDIALPVLMDSTGADAYFVIPCQSGWLVDVTGRLGIVRLAQEVDPFGEHHCRQLLTRGFDFLSVFIALT